MRSRYYQFKKRAISLRKHGRTYGEIREALKQRIPKSTLSCWFQDLVITDFYRKRLNRVVTQKIKKAHSKALATNKERREQYIRGVQQRIKHLPAKLKDKDIAKIALAMLFWGEGSKTPRGYVMFGNSDPAMMRLFMNLLRHCYAIDENKFRCTLQCRADQDIKALEKFWSKTTQVPLSQFYKAQIDPRTIGKPSRNHEYKGVCRVDYFSGDIFMEFKQIINAMNIGPVA